MDDEKYLTFLLPDNLFCLSDDDDDVNVNNVDVDKDKNLIPNSLPIISMDGVKLIPNSIPKSNDPFGSKELIPSLPNDIALECLIRLPIDSFPAASAVSNSWKAQIAHPEFRRRRRASGMTRLLMVFAQAWCHSWSGNKTWSPSLFRLTVYDHESNDWSELPPLPWFRAGLPMFCKIVAVGSDLLVLGGIHPVTCRVISSVFIYSFISSTWRLGSEIPGPQRAFFACASDSERTVYVAGGHDRNKHALTSALAYDVANDVWTPLPDMARERDECRGVFRNGKFQVLSGFRTERQGWFGTDMECYDVSGEKWGEVADNYLEEGFFPAMALGDCDVEGRMYVFGKRNVLTNNDESDVAWKILAGYPDGVSNVSYVTTWQGKRLMIGYEEQDGTHNAYTMDLNLGEDKWTKMDSPQYFKGLPQSVCCLYL